MFLYRFETEAFVILCRDDRAGVQLDEQRGVHGMQLITAHIPSVTRTIMTSTFSYHRLLQYVADDPGGAGCLNFTSVACSGPSIIRALLS